MSTSFKMTSVPTTASTDRDQHTHQLIEDLVEVAVDHAGAEHDALIVFEDGIDELGGEDAGEDCAYGPAHAVHTEGVERIVVAEARP